MSYTAVLRGAVHAQSRCSDYTVCGKWITHLYAVVGDPITCKVCSRSIEASRDFRVARELSKLVRCLYDDMTNKPDAYMHADSRTIFRMKEIVEGE